MGTVMSMSMNMITTTVIMITAITTTGITTATTESVTQVADRSAGEGRSLARWLWLD